MCNGLSRVGLIEAEGGTRVNFKWLGLVVWRQFQLDAGDGQFEPLCKTQTAVGQRIGKLDDVQFRVTPLPLRIAGIGRLGVNGCREESRADSVHKDVSTLNKDLELCRARANAVEPLEILRLQGVNDGAHAAYRFVDHTPMLLVKGTHGIRIVGDQHFRHSKVVCKDQLH